MDSEESRTLLKPVAPGLQNDSKKKRDTPWMEDNKNAKKHGVFTAAFSAEELQEREQFEAELLADTGGSPPAGVRSLIRTAGMLWMKINRCDRAIKQGFTPPDNFVLAWVNSFRLILGQIGLERRAKPGPTLAQYLKAKEEAKAGTPEESKAASSKELA
jgi:hypothetical protein